MRRVNLLPERWLQEGARRRRRLPCYLVAVGLMGGLTAGLMLTRTHTRELEVQIAEAEQALAPLRLRAQELEKWQSNQQAQIDRIEAADSVRDPASIGAVLALLSQVAPDEVALSQLVIDVPLPPAIAAQGRDSRKQPMHQLRSVRVQLRGMATRDSLVARFVSALSDRGIFKNVRLDDSRQGAFSEHVCHEFQISMDVPLIPENESAQANRRSRGS